jgi:hypothetical protein
MDHRDGPAHGMMLLNRTDHSGDRQSIQHHSRLQASKLREAAASGFYGISNLNRLHASTRIVAVRETIPRRSARYRANVNNDSRTIAHEIMRRVDLAGGELSDTLADDVADRIETFLNVTTIGDGGEVR